MKNLYLKLSICMGLLIIASVLGCRRYPDKELPPPRLAERNEALSSVRKHLENLQSAQPEIAINLTEHGDFRVRRAAAQQLAELQVKTPEALAALSTLLEDDHPRVRTASLNALVDLQLTEAIPSMIPLLVDPESSVRLRAQKSLKSFGEEGIEALIQAMGDPRLLEALYYEDLRRKKVPLSHRVFDTLVTAGTDAVQPLIRSLGNEEKNIRTGAPLILAKIGDPARAAIEPMLEILDGDEPVMRATCARALGVFGRLDERIVPKLEELASNPDETVAKGARAGLGAISRHASDAEQRRKHLERQRERARKRRENAKKIYDGRKVKSE